MVKTSIIPIFIPHIGCPYRCVFCNQWRITGRRGVPDGNAVARTIKEYVTSAAEERHWEVAFYGGSFTAIPMALQEELLTPAREALQEGRIQAIRCSTRPDCIDEEILSRLKRYGLSTIELGVQSMDDVVLDKAKRGHTAQDVVTATALLREHGFTVGHQLMPGLPGFPLPLLLGRFRNQARHPCRVFRLIQRHIARIYPVVVIADTELADMYRKGEYTPLSVHEGVVRAAYMKQAFVETGIQCIRTGLQATEDLDDPAQVLAGAYAPAMGEMVDTRRYCRQLFAVLDCLGDAEQVIVEYNRRDTSRVRGYKNTTVKKVQNRYSFSVQWKESAVLPAGVAAVSAGRRKIYIEADAGRIKDDL